MSSHHASLLLCRRRVQQSVPNNGAIDGRVQTLTTPQRTGKRGRPRLALPDGVLLVHVVKSPKGRRLAEVTRRVVVGTEDAVARVIVATHGGPQINTASSARLNATFRAHRAPLARRGRASAHGTALVASGRGLVGCASNVCWVQQSLRLRASGGRTWLERTPALAAGLTAQRWTREEVLRYPIPPRARTVTATPRRGRTRAHGRLLPFPACPAPLRQGRPHDHTSLWRYPAPWGKL